MKLIAVLLLAFLIVVAVNAKFEKSCGKKLVNRVDRVCPNGCQKDLQPEFATFACSQGLTDRTLMVLCCPNDLPSDF